MAHNVDFTEAKLSTVLDGLIPLVDTPPAVSRSLNLIVHAVAVPLDPPEDDPDADPQFRQLMMANDKRGSLYDRVGAFACSDDGKLWTGIASDDVHWLVVNHEKKGQLGAGRPFVSPDGSGYACTQTVREGESSYPKTRVSIGDQRVNLNQGDSLYFQADADHSFLNLGKTPCEYFLVIDTAKVRS